MRWGGNDGGQIWKKLQKQVVFDKTTCFCWSEMGDSNSRHLAPKASALPTALIPDMKFRLIRRPDVLTQECVYKMTTPQNLTAVHVACRKRTECRRKTILYFTEICRKVKSYIEEAPCPYGHGALILATAAAIAATAVVAAAPTAAAAAAPDDDQQNDDPAAVPAASATVITAHIGTSYEIEM